MVQTAWCAVCFRSSDVKWKKHVFTRNHQNKARDFLRRRVELVDACLKQPKSATATSAELRSVSWKCVFCELPGYVVVSLSASYGNAHDWWRP